MPERRRGLRGLLRFEGNRPIVVLLAIGAALLAISIAASIALLNAAAASTRMVEHGLAVQAEINRLISYNERVETARRGFLLTPDDGFVKVLRTAQTDFRRSLAELQSLTRDNDSQATRLEQVAQLAERREQVISDTIVTPGRVLEGARSSGLDREPGVVITRQVRVLSDQMLDEEDNLLFARYRAQTESRGRFYLMSSVATLLLLATLVSVIFLVLRFNRDLSLTQARLKQANEGLEAAVAARTAELTRANSEIQRFAYIVSHDLRSPLVNVLGFTAELDQARKTIRTYLERLFQEHPEMRDQGVWLAADEDLPEALDFIRKSTEKMDRLINSILELSRQGRRPLTPEHLDMNALADGVAASLYQLAEDKGAQVVVEPLPPVESDRVAVEQILSNLVENALKYLDPKRPGRVEVTGRRAGKSVEIAVRDNGRGIAPADHERVFDLFRRAGQQDQPGEGIGLANVRAVAYRLGGTITLQSALDEGAVFTLTLPERFTALETAA